MTLGAADEGVFDGDTLALWEPHIRAFVEILPVATATHEGVLSGLTFGVKDIIDVEGAHTCNGSATSLDVSLATKDAEVVAALRAQGARVVGKTSTTEFAFTDPTDCRNPHDLSRTPGGSSSGSGAAVAAGLVDFALGTQTAGSLCRPAAYCGVVGFKPTYGALSRAGVTPLAPSFDSVGVIAKSVTVAKSAFAVMDNQKTSPEGKLMTFVRWLLPGEVKASSDTLSALDAATKALALNAEFLPPPSVPCDPQAIVDAHRMVMLAEAFEAHGCILRSDQAKLLRPKFRAALDAGAGLNAADVSSARQTLRSAADAFWSGMQDVDAILTVPVPEGAPKLGDGTGFQDWLTPWTVFGGPLVSLPWGIDREGRPRAVMLAGRPGSDMPLLTLAQQLEDSAPARPIPKRPAV